MIINWSGVQPFLDDDKHWLAVVEQSHEVRGTAEFDAARLVLDFVKPKNAVR